MNREQAKIIGQMSDEQLGAVGRPEWIANRKWIVAYGEGQKVKCHFEPKENMSFMHKPSVYSIELPKITFNGVEIDAPIKERPHKSTPVWFAMTDDEKGILVPVKIMGSHITDSCLMSGSYWAAEEACQLYCDTHNKMMGIEV